MRKQLIENSAYEVATQVREVEDIIDVALGLCNGLPKKPNILLRIFDTVEWSFDSIFHGS